MSLRGPRMTEEQTEEILAGLLLNIYKSFDYREEEAIYDGIARTTSGDVLREIYLQTRRSLELANQGGARAKVLTVDVVEATPELLGGEPGFKARTTWNVTGSVGHWGHVHQRSNPYLADITVRVIDDTWRITDLEVLSEERIQASPSASTVPGGMKDGARHARRSVVPAGGVRVHHATRVSASQVGRSYRPGVGQFGWSATSAPSGGVKIGPRMVRAGVQQ